MIRQAISSDASSAVPLMMQAFGHLAFVLTGTDDEEEAAGILGDFFKEEANRISFENTLVLEEGGEVVGLVILYDGAQARRLDLPLERAAALVSGDPRYFISTEPEESEFYLDTLSVDPCCQGRGYGSKLIEAGCELARRLGHKRVGLLVEESNTGAKRLYERLGFRVDYTRQIAGEGYFHMVRSLVQS